ncbi:hypothetical protein F4777DRAFT_556489 [Nemania sp. FL0916]|nr:hypothetical protein F4777DRAFT_556489 [Nemania sp. FL0916]
MDNTAPTPQSHLLWRLGISMTILPTLAIVCRFWSRTITSAGRKLWWDDWLALLAWGACIVNCSFTIYGVKLGLGNHFEYFKSVDDVTTLLRIFYVSQIVFDSGIAFAKFSALLFYRRIFSSTSKSFNNAWNIVFALVAVFILYKLPAQIFSCIPPRKNWLPSIPGHCENDYTNFGLLLAGLILDILTDLLILLLPMPIVFRLHTSRRKKLALFGAFFLGYITLVTSIGRTAAFISIKPNLGDPDISWYQVPELAWSLAEISVSVVSICIPSCFYIVKRWAAGGVASLFTTKDLSITPAQVFRGGRRHHGAGGFELDEEDGLSHSWSQKNQSLGGSAPALLHDGPSNAEIPAHQQSLDDLQNQRAIRVQNIVALSYDDSDQERPNYVTRHEWVG